MSDLLMSLMIKEQMSKSLFFLSKSLIHSFDHKKQAIRLKKCDENDIFFVHLKKQVILSFPLF